MLTIENLYVSYAVQPVLEDINLNIYEKETLGLIGLNGAGKTTLIKTILGLRQPNSGRILYEHGQVRASSFKAMKKRIAYLPERFEPPSFLKGEEFIRFSASLYKHPLASSDIVRAAENLELDPSVLKRGVNTYSKGMRQKLGLIATMLTGCDFLILDEPMSGLDPQARSCVKENIVKMRQYGRTVFLSSHILSDMSEICDRVAVIYKGRLQYDGAPRDMMTLYKTRSLEKAFLKLIETNDSKAA